LIVQLQSVSESPIRTIKCGEDSIKFVDVSNESLSSAKIPHYVVLFMCFSNINI
ncbi:hypothetical protein M9458_045021, partial [Cirrhinus mrigala]